MANYNAAGLSETDWTAGLYCAQSCRAGQSLVYRLRGMDFEFTVWSNISSYQASNSQRFTVLRTNFPLDLPKVLISGIYSINKTIEILRIKIEWTLTWTLKIFTLADSKSFLSMPSRRGMAPTRNAASTSLKATATSAVGMTSTRQNNFNYPTSTNSDYK